jgi:hypothetical protein
VKTQRVSVLSDANGGRRKARRISRNILVRMSRVAALLLVACAPLRAQESKFAFDAQRLPTGKLFEYRKSNIDGTNASNIFVYVRDKTQVESFKRWHEPATRATLVVAQMDWQRWSVQGFQVFELNCQQEPQPRATLEAGAGEFRVSLMQEPVPLTHTPWHSYDFDFTSLSLVMPMLRDPRGTFSFWRSDFEFEPVMRFVEMGEVTVKFQARETRAGRQTLRYSIGGAGLKNTVGTLWADAAAGTLVEFEIPIPDEPGFKDVRLQLLSTSRMSPEEWSRHKQVAPCAAAH